MTGVECINCGKLIEITIDGLPRMRGDCYPDIDITVRCCNETKH